MLRNDLIIQTKPAANTTTTPAPSIDALEVKNACSDSNSEARPPLVANKNFEEPTPSPVGNEQDDPINLYKLEFVEEYKTIERDLNMCIRWLNNQIEKCDRFFQKHYPRIAYHTTMAATAISNISYTAYCSGQFTQRVDQFKSVWDIDNSYQKNPCSYWLYNFDPQFYSYCYPNAPQEGQHNYIDDLIHLQTAGLQKCQAALNNMCIGPGMKYEFTPLMIVFGIFAPACLMITEGCLNFADRLAGKLLRIDKLSCYKTWKIRQIANKYEITLPPNPSLKEMIRIFQNAKEELQHYFKKYNEQREKRFAFVMAGAKADRNVSSARILFDHKESDAKITSIIFDFAGIDDGRKEILNASSKNYAGTAVHRLFKRIYDKKEQQHIDIKPKQ